MNKNSSIAEIDNTPSGPMTFFVINISVVSHLLEWWFMRGRCASPFPTVLEKIILSTHTVSHKHGTAAFMAAPFNMHDSGIPTVAQGEP